MFKFSNMLEINIITAISSLAYGYLLMEGASFCTHPNLIYNIGAVGMCRKIVIQTLLSLYFTYYFYLSFLALGKSDLSLAR